MNIKKITIIFLVFSIFLSFNIVSASDIIANDTFESSISQEIMDDADYSLGSAIEISEASSNVSSNIETSVVADDVSSDIETPVQSSDVSSDNNLSNESDEAYVIYVGKNITSDGGNGSYENPFATLDLACANVSGGKEKIDLNIFEGTYYIGSYLQFNTNNLNINSVNGDVIIKNMYDANNKKQSFGLTSTLANFTCSNIIFDASGWTKRNTGTRWFDALKGEVNLGIFNNCTFTGFDYTNIVYNEKNNLVLNNCKFINIADSRVPFSGICENMNITFNYCIFGATFAEIGMDNAESIIFNDVWFGKNSIPSYISDYLPSRDNLHILRYAIFHVTENYLGNNQYEIIGKLMWNDTTDDDIDKLGPMTVTLTSSSGNFSNNAPILQDGTFKVIYTSNASTHDVTATLDNEIITLNFNTTDIAVETSDIIIGQDQNITVTLPQDFNGTLSIKVNNKTYNTIVDNTNSITYKIPDVLPAGKHVIEVIFADEKNHIYGFNSTNITVSKVSDYDFNANITPNVYIGDNVTVTLSLPDGATGNVTVKVGDNEAKTFNVNETITIDGFIAGKNVVNIIYNGNDVYDAKSVVKNISALNKPTITIPEIDAGKATTTTITLPENATGNVTVFVDGKEYSVVPLTNGSATVTIPELPAGKHNVTISYSGDGNYSGFAQTSAVEVKEPVKPTPKPDDQKPATVKKTATKITAKKKTFKAKKKVKKYTITLKAGKKAVKKVQVILKIGKKTYKAKTNAKGKATFKIKKLTKKGKYTAKITFKGNKLYKATTKKVKITVKK